MCQQFAAAAPGRSSPRSWEGAALPEEPPLCRAPAGGSSRAAPAAPSCPPGLRPRSAQVQSPAKGSDAFNP